MSKKGSNRAVFFPKQDTGCCIMYKSSPDLLGSSTPVSAEAATHDQPALESRSESAETAAARSDSSGVSQQETA